MLYGDKQETRQLTLHKNTLLEKITSVQLLEKFPAFYDTRRLFTVFITGHSTTFEAS
jgi:hypothetical protein